MSPYTISIIGIVVFLAIVMLGMPVAYSFAIVGVIGISVLKGLDVGLSILGTATYQWASQAALVVIPLFILMGQFAFHSGISRDLYDSAYKWIGKFCGGLALATMIACTGFAACTGSSLASAATMATVGYPEMTKFNYNSRLSTACIAAGGTLGILIPPSGIFIIYGALTRTSIGKLFIAGILPGLMLSGMFLMLIFVMCKRNPKLGPPGEAFSWRKRLVSLTGVWGMLLLFLLVVGGLYFGFFAPSEAASIGAFVAFLIALGKHRITKSVLVAVLKDTARMTCFMMTVVIGSLIFGTFLTVGGAPAAIARWVTALPFPPIVILIAILLLYIPLGMVMDILAMILLTLPVVFPIITALGYDPVWFGVLLVVECEMGLITPPVGMNVYVIQGVTKVSMADIFAGILPFFFIMMVGIAMLVAFPQISLFLPSLMK